MSRDWPVKVQKQGKNESTRLCYYGKIVLKKD